MLFQSPDPREDRRVSSIKIAPAPHTAPPAGEHRKSPRYDLLRRCIARPVVPGASGGWRCIAYNVSAGGIGIALPLPLRPGTGVMVGPWTLPGARPLRVRVVHSSPLEYVWLCGCELAEPLTDEE